MLHKLINWHNSITLIFKMSLCIFPPSSYLHTWILLPRHDHNLFTWFLVAWEQIYNPFNLIYPDQIFLHYLIRKMLIFTDIVDLKFWEGFGILNDSATTMFQPLLATFVFTFGLQSCSSKISSQIKCSSFVDRKFR